jgi:hypothetical protein
VDKRKEKREERKKERRGLQFEWKTIKMSLLACENETDYVFQQNIV